MAKAQYTKVELTSILTKNGYKLTQMEKVSETSDVYTKGGKQRISLPKRNIIQFSELSPEMKKLIS